MAFRLNLDEPLASSVRDCASAELEMAAHRLEREPDRVAAVHGARKNLKKTRALLRLVRSALGEGAYRRENGTLAEVGRSVSGARDADVVAQTADTLSKRFGTEFPASAFDELRAYLKQRAQSSRDAASVDDARITDLVVELRSAAARARSWPLEAADTETLRLGTRAAYRRGRKAMRRAEKEPSVERLHEWRKRVKDLWYHHRLLDGAWPSVMHAYADELHELSEQLGDDHDLAVLAQLVQSPEFAGVLTTHDRAVVTEAITRRRVELQAQARTLGKRIYAERPKAFEARLLKLLRAPPSQDVAENGTSNGHTERVNELSSGASSPRP